MSNEMNRFDQVVGKQVEEEVIEMGAVGKAVNIFIAPTKAFKALRQKPDVLIPLIIVPLVMVLYYVVFWSSIEAMLIRQIEQQYAAMGIDAQTSAGMIEASMGMQRITTPIGVVVGFFVGLVINAFYLWIAGKFAKAKLTYGRAFVLSANVSLLALVSFAIMIVMTLILGEYDTTRPMTSLVSLIPNLDNTSMLYFVALPIEVVAFWGLAVTYIGLVVFAKFSKTAAMVTVIAKFAFVMFLSIGGGLFTQFIMSLTMG